MIPPTDSLLKYDTPVLVSRNTEKRSPKVRMGLGGAGEPGNFSGEADVLVEDQESLREEAAATGSRGNWVRKEGGRVVLKAQIWDDPTGQI